MNKFEVVRCSSCGSSQVTAINDKIGECKHCKSTMILPRNNEEIIALLNSAQIYRENYNYDLAIKSYQYVLEKDTSEASAYEGILLAKYGIEYVKDAYTGKLIPTCHRAHFKSIYEDEYYLSLMIIATEEQKQVIEQKVKEIDKLQKSIEKQLKNEQSYDIFISYKATDKNGEKTEDSLISREIYEELTKKNYKVFLAEKSLEDRLGSEYEPIIFKALHTSKLFILVGTKKEYIEANWVRNEWSRFIDRIKNNEDLPKGCFIPVFKNMNPYDMPKVNNTLVQSVDAGKLGYLVTLVDGVSKLLKPEEEKSVLKTFTDVENFAEFERIKKEKKKELKRKKWQELKNSSGIKKWFYLAFLYSPYLFGLIALVSSCFLNSHFTKEPLFWITVISAGLAVSTTIITILTHSILYRPKFIVNIISPIALILSAVLIYLYVSIPVTTSFNNPRSLYNAFNAHYTNHGLIFETNEQQEEEYIWGLLNKGYEDNIIMYEGKKTLVLPDYGKHYKITTINEFCIPEDIECLVLPKYALHINLYVNGETLKEIYCYGIYEEVNINNMYTQVVNQTSISLTNIKNTLHFQIPLQNCTLFIENVNYKFGPMVCEKTAYIDSPFYN